MKHFWERICFQKCWKIIQNNFMVKIVLNKLMDKLFMLTCWPIKWSTTVLTKWFSKCFLYLFNFYFFYSIWLLVDCSIWLLLFDGLLHSFFISLIIIPFMFCFCFYSLASFLRSKRSFPILLPGRGCNRGLNNKLKLKQEISQV